MARKTLDVINVAEMLMHRQSGPSKSEMAASLGTQTAAEVHRPAEAAGIPQGSPPMSGQGWADVVLG
jgi:hypothetical protein